MASTFQRDVDALKTNQRAKYLGPRSCSSKVIVRTHTETHITLIVVPGLLEDIPRKLPVAQPTSVSVVLIVGSKCTLAASACYTLVSHGEYADGT